MPHALLLSPDDQAVTAITGVLEEMSVTCERPLDGASAAQKLNSQSFDLVLVDCENLPAAKLIFDVCRRGKHGNNPVPIAIVDGRAGLPTAFRLGAELILTKPVAKDQARGTIRTAVSRVRKTVPTNESIPAQAASAPTIDSAITGSAIAEERAQAAAAGASSSPLTTYAEASPAVTTKMDSAVEDIDATPAAVKSKSARPLIPSDDPVLAELERTELEESERAESQLAESQKSESQKENPEPAKAAPDKPAAESTSTMFSSYQQGRQKTRGPLVALVMLTLVGAGFYAAWTYQPGFQAVVQPQVERAIALVGMALPPASAPTSAKPSVAVVAAKTPAPAPATPTDPNQPPSTAPDSAINSASDSSRANADATTTPAAATVPVQPSAVAAKTTAVAPAPSGATTAPVALKPGAGKPGDIVPSGNKNDNKNDSKSAAAVSSSAPLPGENTAVILSSKGAENRLTHSVPPKYPAEAQAEGTVVLKTVVDDTGKVEGVRLVEGDATLATAAMQAVKQRRYRPYVRDGKALPFQTVVIVDFQRP